MRGLLFAGLLGTVVFGTGAYFRESEITLADLTPGEPDQLTVWSSERPTGKCWEKLGSRGFFRINEDVAAYTRPLTLHMEAEGNRICGLNWKGWYPDNAGDDVSAFKCLTLRIRQTTSIAEADLNVTMVDNCKDPGKRSNSLSLRTDGGTPAINNEWQKISIPLEKFCLNRPLLLTKLWGIEFENNQKGKIEFQIDSVSFTNDTPPMPKFENTGKTFTATTKILKSEGYAISDRIYGVCALPPEKLREYGIPLTRFGGNTSSRYNWKINADSGVKDWYFKNRGQSISDPTENAYLKLIRTNQQIDASAYITVPMLGWVAKDNRSYSYSVRKYGSQKQSEPGYSDVGNGQNDRGICIRNEPEDASMKVDPSFIAEAVRLTVRHAGNAANKGVKYWVLDNEPMLWHETHRDVHPNPATYDELWERTVAWGEAIKREDPTAKIAGFCSWGWNDLFSSAADRGDNEYRTRPDSARHGGMPLGEWFIRKCADYRQKTGRQLVDVFDFHWYPQEAQTRNPYEHKGMEKLLNQYRLRSTGDLWDPTYTPESWIRQAGDGRPAQVIRRIRLWLNKHNPGMELCLGEYNFGGADNITGGIAQADVLGILAREHVDMAYIWQSPEGSQDLAWQLYRSYDGKSARFGNLYLPSVGDNPDIAVHAARRKSDSATTIVVINRNLSNDCEFKLDSGLTGKMKAFRFDQQTGSKVQEVKELAGTINGTISLKLPALSATLLVIE